MVKENAQNLWILLVQTLRTIERILFFLIRL